MSIQGGFNFEIDEELLKYYDGKLKQVFFYLTDKCQLRCKQCLYKPNLVFQMNDSQEIHPDTVKMMMEDFRKLGAIKLTLMGGEPALYGDEQHQDLVGLIKYAKQLGYKYVRMDSNGQADESFLRTPGMELLDEISFSIDGYDADTHDFMRGQGTFEKVINSVRVAKELGMNVDVTTCGHKGLLTRNSKGETGFEQMVHFCEEIGVQRLNFHVLFKHGFPMDTWTEDTDVTYADWIPLFNELLRKKSAKEFKIEVRLPQHFVNKETFDRQPEYYGYCAAKLGERILVHPDGMLRVCSGLISSKYGIGRYYGNKMLWDHGATNELRDHDFSKKTPCTNQGKTMDTGGYLPLCFSFKPGQTEIVYDKALKWENQKRPEQLPPSNNEKTGTYNL